MPSLPVDLTRAALAGIPFVLFLRALNPTYIDTLQDLVLTELAGHTPESISS